MREVGKLPYAPFFDLLRDESVIVDDAFVRFTHQAKNFPGYCTR